MPEEKEIMKEAEKVKATKNKKRSIVQKKECSNNASNTQSGTFTDDDGKKMTISDKVDPIKWKQGKTKAMNDEFMKMLYQTPLLPNRKIREKIDWNKMNLPWHYNIVEITVQDYENDIEAQN